MYNCMKLWLPSHITSPPIGISFATHILSNSLFLRDYWGVFR